MSKRRSSRIPFSPERVEQAIRHSGRKKKDLFPETDLKRLDDNQMLSRSYRRCKSQRRIKPSNLEWLARELGVATAYLAGELDWPLEQLNSEDLRRAYEERILDPSRFPYDGWYQIRNQVDYKEYERQLFEVHGIDHSRFASLGVYEQMSLLGDIDTAVCKKLNKVFPECIKIDYYDIFQGYDIRDIVDNLIDDLMDGFLDYEPSDEESKQQEDRFAAKYMPDCISEKLWGYGYVLDVVAEGSDASRWQALAVSMLIQKWNVVDSSAEKLKGCLRDYYSSPDDEEEDLYWTVRPKTLIASGSCTENKREILLRCDCRVGRYRQLNIRFINEEFEGINLG